MIKIAVMGYGTVGSGVVDILTEHKNSISKRANQEIDLKYILDVRDFPNDKNSDKFIKDFEVILNDPEVQIVVEAIGGITYAYDFTKQALLHGKSVVTSNKELVAKKGSELLQIAIDNNLNFLFEASVGGGIPIIRPLNQCLAANDVIEVGGILNGTTNFILTKMIRENMKFDDALALAKQYGYAEADPTDDIDGKDACRKICILASLAFGKHVYPQDVHTEGISNITLEDVSFAKAYGGVIKLIAQVSKMENGRIQISVEPMIVSNESQLSTVDDVFNAILVRGDSTGDVIFYGKGAGKLPTASAVVADIMDCAKHVKTRKYISWQESEHGYIMPYKDTVTSAFIKVNFDGSKENAISLLEQYFDNIRLLNYDGQKASELGFVTDVMSIGKINSKLNNLEDQGISVNSIIRISDL